MTSHVIQCLIELEIYGTSQVNRYQNYQLEDLQHDGEIFVFLGFQVEGYPQSSLELAGQQATVWLRDTGPIGSLVRQYDGLRRSVVTLIHLLDSASPIVWRLQVSSSSPQRGYFVFNLNTPTSALQGQLVTRYINSQDHPELLFVNPREVLL